MTNNLGWRRAYHSHHESAIMVVRDCVTQLRERGVKTDAALRDLAEPLGSTHRRMRTLFHRIGDPLVLIHEIQNLRYRAGLFFLNEAARHRALAAKCERVADELLADQLEFSWDAPCKSRNGRGGHAAAVPGSSERSRGHLGAGLISASGSAGR
jgi:hypothetical protein